MEFLVPVIQSDIVIDGIGNEKQWNKTEWQSEFWLWRPNDSLKASKQTRFKILRSEKNLFVLIDLFTDGTKFVTPSLRRDFDTFGGDTITLLFDTFNDGTNAFSFTTNPLGLKKEGLISGGNQNYRTDRNYSWDTKWLVESKIYEDRYSVEIKIPLTSLFYNNSSSFWRLNIYRGNAQNNEYSVWARTPQNQIIGNLAFMGKMVFDKPLKKARNPLSVIPYISGMSQKDFLNKSSASNSGLGGDAKIPIGNALNLDLTYNPDFSQVEVDDQVVNLTRFAIALPEKRQFFTQNDDLFKDFGSTRDVVPFFSRRIGVAKDLEGNTIENKIIAGVRLSGKLNSNLRLGFLNIITDADIKNEIPSNLNTVFTLRQKVFDRSNISFFFLDRTAREDYDFLNNEEKKNSVTGIEYNLASTDSKWTGRAYFHKSFTEGLDGDDQIIGMRINRNTLKQQIGMEWVHGGEDFRSDLGFFRRTGFLKLSPEYTYRIYPKNPNVISYSFTQRGYFVYDTASEYLMTDRVFISTIRKSFLNFSSLSLDYTNRYIYLVNDFNPTRSSDGVFLPSGSDYSYGDLELSYRSDRRKYLNFDSKISYGTFYNGTKFTVENEIKWRKQPVLNASMIMNFNSIELPRPYSSKNIWLISPKIDFTFTKSLFWTTFIQYNSQGENLGINSRLQWRFAPLSDLFIVYNDNYISTDNFSPRYRSFNLKLTYWINI
ncbi:MAG: hydrolase [Flavobacteriaceae bacterium TMED179]|nr:MAG: hydrolase [Flavobacteriaceae bacterium TMED179]